VSDAELQEFLYAADIYVTPYLYKEQLTSGTLAFAVGTGKAVVSTPYWAAEELLAENRGKLVAFGDSEQMASAVIELLNDNTALSQMQLRAYQYGRSITWPKIGQAYWNLLTHSEPPIMEITAPERYPRIKELQPVMSVGGDANHSIPLAS
jgi:glycosyltransferase involved in cell wall biosynthesis